MSEPNPKSVALLGEIEISAATIVVRLSRSPIDPLVDTLLLSAIQEATFPGYDRVKALFEACEVPDDEFAEIASQEIVFEAGVIVTAQPIYFAYMTSTPLGGIEKIIGMYEFPDPILVDTEGMQVSTGAWRLKRIAEAF